VKGKRREDGFEHARGSISDVSQIVSALHINGINMCAGYYGAHTGSEKVVVEELLASIDWLSVVMVPELHQYLLENAELIKYKPTTSVWTSSYYGGVRTYGGYGGVWTSSVDNYGTFGGLSSSKAITSDSISNTEDEDTLEDLLEMWTKVLDDVELVNGWYMLEQLAEDACYKLSSSGKSLIIISGWANHSDELDVVNRSITVTRGKDLDAVVKIEDIEDYIEQLESTGFNCFDENGEWL
jgi:hypothetical protein